MRALGKFFNSSFKKTKFMINLQDDVQSIKDHLLLNGAPVTLTSGVRMHVPYQLEDVIQCILVRTKTYFEIDILRDLNKYLPDNAVILDIGSNIGNHSIYWATERNPEKIYAFEPVKNTYDLLLRNIGENDLNDKIRAFNLGITDKKTKASIKAFNPKNIGATQLKESNEGEMELTSVDSFVEENKIPKVDFIKIDTEGFEIPTLEGAKGTIKSHKPVIFIEAFPPNQKKVDDILVRELGYKKEKYYDQDNFLYLPQ